MMRALTLTQPWCGLVSSGIKLVENRPRPIIRNAEIVMGPVTFALHASREVDSDVVARLRQTAPDIFENDQLPRWIRLGGIRSAVIAVATVYEVKYIGGCSRRFIEELCAKLGIPDQARWMFGPTCYLLRDVRALAEPVPCRGWQGFWTLPPDIEARVAAQLARAA